VGPPGGGGGRGAFGGFILPPVLSTFVRIQGQGGYAAGFLTYVALGILAFAITFELSRAPARSKTAEAVK